MSIKIIKQQVIHNIIIRSTLSGALQRNHLYHKAVGSAQRRDFRNFLARELAKTLERIVRKGVYTDSDHYRTIETFASKISKDKVFSSYLNGRALNIGTAQKLINLFGRCAGC